MFDNILEKDEQIVKIIKPSKRRYWKSLVIPFAIPLFWPHFILIMVATLFTFPFFYSKGYKNLYYAYTNKRLIVRSGIFGINYQSLEYKDITSTAVSVGFLDKSSNTGSLNFVSPSSHQGKPMTFSYIENPYETMKEIKEYINALNFS